MAPESSETGATVRDACRRGASPPSSAETWGPARPARARARQLAGNQRWHGLPPPASSFGRHRSSEQRLALPSARSWVSGTASPRTRSPRAPPAPAPRQPGPKRRAPGLGQARPAPRRAAPVGRRGSHGLRGLRHRFGRLRRSGDGPVGRGWCTDRERLSDEQRRPGGVRQGADQHGLNEGARRARSLEVGSGTAVGLASAPRPRTRPRRACSRSPRAPLHSDRLQPGRRPRDTRRPRPPSRAPTARRRLPAGAEGHRRADDPVRAPPDRRRRAAAGRDRRTSGAVRGAKRSVDSHHPALKPGQIGLVDKMEEKDIGDDRVAGELPDDLRVVLGLRRLVCRRGHSPRRDRRPTRPAPRPASRSRSRGGAGRSRTSAGTCRGRRPTSPA